MLLNCCGGTKRNRPDGRQPYIIHSRGTGENLLRTKPQARYAHVNAVAVRHILCGPDAEGEPIQR